MKETLCDVCNKNPVIGVASMPGVPVSVGYCQTCYGAGAHPYWIVVGNTAQVGGYDEAAEWWQQIVDDTLAHLGIDRKTFDKAVDDDIKWMYEEEGHEGTD